MIQAVVSRLSSQSTAVKAWCVTVTAALLSFSATATTPLVPVIALYVVLAFAVLDAYYLCLERAYRLLFQRAAEGLAGDWLLTVSRPTWREVVRALGSPSIAVLYGSSLVAAVGIGCYLLITRS
jgi:hypothetical protein